MNALSGLNVLRACAI